MSGIGVGFTESDDRSLCPECGGFYEGRCPCRERVAATAARAERTDPLGKPDPDFWRDSAARRNWAREERKKQQQSKGGAR